MKRLRLAGLILCSWTAGACGQQNPAPLRIGWLTVAPHPLIAAFRADEVIE